MIRLPLSTTDITGLIKEINQISLYHILNSNTLNEIKKKKNKDNAKIDVLRLDFI